MMVMHVLEGGFVEEQMIEIDGKSAETEIRRVLHLVEQLIAIGDAARNDDLAEELNYLSPYGQRDDDLLLGHCALGFVEQIEGVQTSQANAECHVHQEKPFCWW